MPAKNDTSKAIDPGLATFVVLLRVHGVDTNADQIRNRYGTKAVRIREMLRYARLGKRAPTTKWSGATHRSRHRVLRDGGFIPAA
jgi:subfamily B ATP-binding cassette protein HlyB/CyaB